MNTTTNVQKALRENSANTVRDRMKRESESVQQASQLVREMTVDRFALDLLTDLRAVKSNRNANIVRKKLGQMTFDKAVKGLVESCCPGLRPGCVRRISEGAPYKSTKPGDLVLVQDIRVKLENFQNQGDSVPLIMTVWHLNEKGQIQNPDEAYELNAYHTETIDVDEEIAIVTVWDTPDPEFTQLFDGNPVELREDVLKNHKTFFGMVQQKFHKGLKGIVDVPDLRTGMNASDINNVTETESRRAISCRLKVLDRWSEISMVDLSVPIAGSGFMYSVYIPAKREHVEFERSQLKKRVYDKQMLDRVIMPEENRDVILGAVMGDPKHLEGWGIDDAFNKGTGTILLAYGPPGTGKTMTAEALAEYMERPLYVVDSSDLGDEASEFEEGIKKVFDRARRWNAVVLFDEAEVYIGARKDGDIQANARVAAMLRHLEHFKGVLFLTTNRPVQVDYAIDSRVHAQVYYPDFTAEQREAVWRTSIPVRMPCKPSDEEFSAISELKINGREIKTSIINAARAASYLKQQGKLDSADIPFSILLGSAKNIANSSVALRESRENDWSSFGESSQGNNDSNLGISELVTAVVTELKKISAQPAVEAAQA